MSEFYNPRKLSTPPHVSSITVDPEDDLIAGKSVEQLNAEVKALLESGNRKEAEKYWEGASDKMIEILNPNSEEDTTKKD